MYIRGLACRLFRNSSATWLPNVPWASVGERRPPLVVWRLTLRPISVYLMLACDLPTRSHPRCRTCLVRRECACSSTAQSGCSRVSRAAASFGLFALCYVAGSPMTSVLSGARMAQGVSGPAHSASQPPLWGALARRLHRILLEQAKPPQVVEPLGSPTRPRLSRIIGLDVLHQAGCFPSCFRLASPNTRRSARLASSHVRVGLLSDAICDNCALPGTRSGRR